MAISKLLKASLYLSDITKEESSANCLKSNMLTIQHFSYQFCRSRDKNGTPFGPTPMTLLTFSVRLVHAMESKLFYDKMQADEPVDMTFFFNAVFNQGKLSNYEDAMVARGYIVDVEDTYSSTPTRDGSTEQMLINVQVQLTSVVYLGTEANNSKGITIKQI